jgi:amino acid efflux transporter
MSIKCPSLAQPATGDLARGIGTRGLVVFYITNLVGAGILIVPGLAARIAGPASFVSWAVLVALSFPIARLFAGISARRPDCGGISAMIRIGLGRTAGQTAGILLVLAFVLFNPVMGIASARYACDLFGLGVAWRMPAAAFCMLLSVAFCFARIGTAAKVQGAVLITLIAALAVAIVLLVPSMSAARLEPVAPHGWLSVGSALPVVFLAFIGWESVSAVAEEVRDPRHSFRCAIRIAVPVVGIIYLAVVAAFLAAPHSAGALVMPTLLGPVAGEHGRALADLLALLVIGLCTNSLVLCGSRLVLAAARDGLLPHRLARRSEQTGAPTAALLALAAAYMSMIAVIATLQLDETDVVRLTTAIFMLVYLATVAAVLRDRPDRGTVVSALLAGGSALCMLAFTGPAVLVAGSITITLAIILVATPVSACERSPASHSSPARQGGASSSAPRESIACAPLLTRG